jgi:hypothetical protein
MSGGITVSVQKPATVSIPTTDDGIVNGTRSFLVNAKATSGTTGVSGSGTVTILDNDVASPPTPTQTCWDGSVIPVTNECPAPPPPTTQTCPDGSVIPATQACPAPPPVTTVPISGLPDIASNFDINSELVDVAVPGSNAPDTLGAFRFICLPGQILPDDPIVYPGQPGKSHLHQFYGNTSANANSTYESLRTTGDSTCMTPLNRSGYWMPALLDGRGNVVRPDYVTIYYKRYPASSWQCTDGRVAKGCVALPNGLRFIMGRDMLNLSAPPTGNFHFLCDNNTGSWPTLQQALAVCSAGHHLDAVVDAPTCWDGKNLDSPDHRSHVAYMVDSHMGYPKCPDTHPYIIPGFVLGANYLIVAGEDTSGWKFSSDDMAPNEPAGSTFHADWFGAWDNTVMAMWTDNCINKLLNCSSGVLGNGKMLKQSYPFTWTANPRLVPLSTIH